MANLSISLHNKGFPSCGCHSLCLSDRFRQLWVVVKDCHPAGYFLVLHLYNSLLFKKNKKMTGQSRLSPNCFNSIFMLQGILFCCYYCCVFLFACLFLLKKRGGLSYKSWPPGKLLWVWFSNRVEWLDHHCATGNGWVWLHIWNKHQKLLEIFLLEWCHEELHRLALTWDNHTGENYFKNSHLFKKIFAGTVIACGTWAMGCFPSHIPPAELDGSFTGTGMTKEMRLTSCRPPYST